jgi:dihydrofolate reductase
MRKVIVSEFVTLDGVMESPEKWVFAFHNKAIERFKLDEMYMIDTLLLGRKTYQIFAGSWPSMVGELADLMNGSRKCVASTTNATLEWNNSHPIQGDLAEEVGKLKQESGRDILVLGSGTLVQALARQNLVDVYRLMVFPIVQGVGKRLFTDGADAGLNLASTRTFQTGPVLLEYETALLK